METRDTKRRLGQVAVETALIMPLFMILLMGIIDFSRYYWTQSILRGAANEGVRLAILDEATDASVISLVHEELAKGGVGETPTVQLSARQPSEPVEVDVSVPFTFIIIQKLIPSLADTDHVSATAVMTHER